MCQLSAVGLHRDLGVSRSHISDKKDFSCIYSDHLFFTHTCPVGRFQTHTPGRTPGQGLQSKGKSKEIVPSMRTEGTRRERADWIKNEVKKELLLSIRVTRVEYQKKAEEIKRVLTWRQIYVHVCMPEVQGERERWVFVLRVKEREKLCAVTADSVSVAGTDGGWGEHFNISKKRG